MMRKQVEQRTHISLSLSKSINKKILKDICQKRKKKGGNNIEWQKMHFIMPLSCTLKRRRGWSISWVHLTAF